MILTKHLSQHSGGGRTRIIIMLGWQLCCAPSNNCVPSCISPTGATTVLARDLHGHAVTVAHRSLTLRRRLDVLPRVPLTSGIPTFPDVVRGCSTFWQVSPPLKPRACALLCLPFSLPRSDCPYISRKTAYPVS